MTHLLLTLSLICSPLSVILSISRKPKLPDSGFPQAICLFALKWEGCGKEQLPQNRLDMIVRNFCGTGSKGININLICAHPCCFKINVPSMSGIVYYGCSQNWDLSKKRACNRLMITAQVIIEALGDPEKFLCLAC